MKQKSEIKELQLLNLLSFIFMVVINALANILPINEITTGGVADLYPNLFTPATITFSIWGLIYLSLAAFIVFQLGLKEDAKSTYLIKSIGIYFITSSLANAAWILSWHYQIIPLSMILMVVILICLIIINGKINATELNTKEKIFVKLPFRIYFGWITVATIANATALLVSLGWNGWGLSQQFWTIIALGLGLIIGIATTIKYHDIAYGLTILWAYLGILIKHLSENGFDGKYPDIIIVVTISLIVIFIAVLYVAIKKIKDNR